jgi:hypothetical protein
VSKTPEPSSESPADLGKRMEYRPESLSSLSFIIDWYCISSKSMAESSLSDAWNDSEENGL